MALILNRAVHFGLKEISNQPNIRAAGTNGQLYQASAQQVDQSIKEDNRHGQ
jgi:hypothetical protein